MIKVLIVTHCGLTKELINAAETIAGKQENLISISKDIQNESLASLQEKISNSLKEYDDGSGCLILTDMLGGTPCNASMKFCNNSQVEILTGVNLPMVLSAIFASKSATNVKELADKVFADSVKSVVNAKQFFLKKLK